VFICYVLPCHDYWFLTIFVNQVEQLHKIFKLCGSPSEEYWKKSKLPHATIFKPQQPYKRCIRDTFKDFPPSSLSLVETLLAIDPAERQTATAALQSEVCLYIFLIILLGELNMELLWLVFCGT
jgi:serine/threonine protein kinase